MGRQSMGSMGRQSMGRMGRMIMALRRWTGSAEAEDGMATAELLGNAALGIAALVAIWAVLQAVGLDVMEWIRGQLQV
jgi:hypothetical protein